MKEFQFLNSISRCAFTKCIILLAAGVLGGLKETLWLHDIMESSTAQGVKRDFHNNPSDVPVLLGGKT